MGKGGQQAVNASVPSEAKEWVSPYKPLEKDSPKLPTKGEIKAVIPAHCFERSYLWSFFYLSRDIAMATGCAFLCSQFLSTDVPSAPLDQAVWVVGWATYTWWMGTILTGLWVLAHECGHGAFSPSQFVNDCVGYVLHQALLVPYFNWQYTHAKHHRRTNHLTEGESHVPFKPEVLGLGYKRRNTVSKMQDLVGETTFAAIWVWVHLVLGMPFYLAGLSSTGRKAHDGTFLNGRLADHWRPSSPLFPEKMRGKVLFCTISEIAVLGALFYAKYQYGVLPVVLWYWGPYFVVNFWLVLITWLQHTHPSIPHYGESDWTWVKGALSTIDRDFGIFDFFHHRLGSTHVVHHLFHEIPWYNADVATMAVKEYLEPMGLYNFDPTPLHKVAWKVAKSCHYVEEDEGIRYYHTLRVHKTLLDDAKEK